MTTFVKKSTSYAYAIFLFGFSQLSFGSIDSHCENEKQYNKNGVSVECKRQIKLNYCTYFGILYTDLAEARDKGESPQQWFQALGKYWEQLFPEKLLKKIINQVYFDPGFVNAAGEKLNYQMRDICLGNTFKPLK
jgi:hypothetical protein